MNNTWLQSLKVQAKILYDQPKPKKERKVRPLKAREKFFKIMVGGRVANAER